MPENAEAGREADNNGGNLINTAVPVLRAKSGSDASHDHPYSSLKPEIIIEAVESTGRQSHARIPATD